MSNITSTFCEKMKQNWVEDKRLLNYKKPILERAFKVLKEIGIYGTTETRKPLERTAEVEKE